MTVATEAFFAQLQWTGAESAFAAGFSAELASHVKVAARDPVTLVSLMLSQGIHYKVVFLADQAVQIMPITLPAPPKTLVIWRDTEAIQNVDFLDLEDFSAADHERLHDRWGRAIAELKGDIERTIRLPISELAPQLPPAAQRSNKALTFDAAGVPTLSSIIAPGTIGTDADNIIYFPPIPGAEGRTVADRLGDSLSIKDFAGPGQPVGIGIQNNDDYALLRAVNYMNSLGPAAFTLYYPDGDYHHGACPQTLLASRAQIKGASTSGVRINYHGGGTWLKIGSRTSAIANHVAVRDLSIDFTGCPADSRFIAFENAFDTAVERIYVRNCNLFIAYGVAGVPASGCYSCIVREVSGFCANQGAAFITFGYGAGFYHNDCQLYNAIPFLPTAPPTQLPAVQGTIALQCTGGNWDEWQVDNCFYQFFDIGVAISVGTVYGGGLCIDMTINNTLFTNCKRHAVLLEAQTGGAIGQMRIFESFLDAWEIDGVLMTGTGGFNDGHQIIGCYFINSGRSNIRSTGTNGINNVIAFNSLHVANVFGAAKAAIHIQGGAGGSIIGNVGNTDDSGSNLPYRAPYGIWLEANCDFYLVTSNRVTGSVGSIMCQPDSLASKSRRIHNNAYADNALYGGYAGVFPTGQTVNSTPFVKEMYVYGGTVSGIAIGPPGNLQLIAGATQGGFRLEPGDTISISASVAPTLTMRVLE